MQQAGGKLLCVRLSRDLRVPPAPSSLLFLWTAHQRPPWDSPFKIGKHTWLVSREVTIGHWLLFNTSSLGGNTWLPLCSETFKKESYLERLTLTASSKEDPPSADRKPAHMDPGQSLWSYQSLRTSVWLTDIENNLMVTKGETGGGDKLGVSG